MAKLVKSAFGKDTFVARVFSFIVSKQHVFCGDEKSARIV